VTGPSGRWRALTSRAMAPRLTAALACLALAEVASGCGQSNPALPSPVVGLKGQSSSAGERLGFPAFATKNTTRVGGADPVADAAAVARAVYPSTSPGTRPAAVAVVDSRDWHGALAGAALMAPPLRAPILLSDGGDLPSASADALSALAPTGSPPAGGAQVISVGSAPRPAGLRNAQIQGQDPFVLAADIDAFVTRARGTPTDAVVVASAGAPEFAMPAAAWAAKSGDPLLFVTRYTVPGPTRVAIAAHQRPSIYVLGPASVVSEAVITQLRALGSVHRVQGPDPVSNSIAFARYIDGTFGWGAIDPGHGLVFASSRRPLDAAAAAPLSASGSYGPLLLTDRPQPLGGPLEQYLLDIQPGYTRDPVRGVYNHGWLIGDEQAISISTQGRIDADLEIVAVNTKPPAPAAAPSPTPPTARTPPLTHYPPLAGAPKPGATTAPKPAAKTTPKPATKKK
jgi:ell wall binding domain 2 (CWB2)